MIPIERTGEYRGLYHVLGGALSPIDGIDPADLKIEELVARVDAGGVEEVVIATNPTTTGEATAHHIGERLRGPRRPDPPRQRPPGRRRPRARRRGHARPRADRPAQRLSQTPRMPDRRDRGHEVRRHLGCRPGGPQARGGADRRRARAGQRASSRCCRRAARRPTSCSTMAREISDRPSPREMDMLLSTGERISCALCAMAIWDLGHQAISLTGSQAGIVTDSSHTKARIVDVRADRIEQALEQDNIVLVAGFQGVSTDSKDVTTLGRGGSDTTAVALAAALGAEVCEIYTDVAGVFSADPRGSCPTRASWRSSPSRRCSRWPPRGHGCCSSAASSTRATTASGSTAAHRSSRAPVPSWSPRTRPWNALSSQPSPTPTEEARVTLAGVRNEPGIAGRIFTALADANVNVDVIIQNEPVSTEHGADLSFTVARDDLATRRRGAHGRERARARARSSTDEQIGKVSIVGAGMRSHPGVAAKVFKVLGDEGINIEMISTSPIKISCVIAADRGRRCRPRAARAPSSLGADAVHAEDPTGEHTAPASDGAVGAPASGSACSGPPVRSARPSSRSSPSARSRSPSSSRSPRRARRASGCRSPAARSSAASSADESIEGLDIVISSAGGAVSSEWAPRLIAAGAVVVDNTSFWRMHERRAARRQRGQPRGRRRPSRPRRQPELLDDADGRGAEADPRRGRDRATRRLDLPVGLRDRAARDRGAAGPVGGRPRRREPEADVYPHQIAFNVLPQVETFKGGDDYTTEERKMMAETRKILGVGEELGISATCVRVPVFNAHSESVNVQTREPLDPDACRELLAAHRGRRRPRRPGGGHLPARDRRRRAATRCSSAGSAAIPLTIAA